MKGRKLEEYIWEILLFNYQKEWIWENEEEESHKKYDFLHKKTGIKIDVKETYYNPFKKNVAITLYEKDFKEKGEDYICGYSNYNNEYIFLGLISWEDAFSIIKENRKIPQPNGLKDEYYIPINKMKNKIFYEDCSILLPFFGNKIFDLCFTDFPYGLNFKGSKNQGNYKDNYNIENLIPYMNLFLEKSKGIMTTVGFKLLDDWIRYKKRDYKHFWINNAAAHSRIEPFLMYGNIKNTKYLPIDIRINSKIDDRIKIHSSPKPIKLYLYILKRLNPQYVLDPFMGSGTTAEACIKLGINYIGFEIRKEYKQDIDKRLQNCRKETKQKTLEYF